MHRRTVRKRSYDPDNHYGVITHLEPDILECEVKWALGSTTMNKASGGDGNPAELFKILKDDAVEVRTLFRKFENLSSGHRTGKGQFSFFNPKERRCQRMLKLPYNCTCFTCQQGSAQSPSRQSSALHEMKTLRYPSWVQEGIGTRDQIANICWLKQKANEVQKNISFCCID